jgi:CRP-like cAMP-binding protein
MLDPNKPSHFPFFSELSARGRSRLLGATRRVKLPPYAKVIERGDEVAGVYLVEAGALRIYYVSSEGREGTLYWVDPGQSCIIALNCLFARLPYPAGVDTDQAETEVAIISGDVYRELYLAEPAPALHVCNSLNPALRTDDTAAGDRIVWSRTTCCSVSSETLGKRSRFGNDT